MLVEGNAESIYFGKDEQDRYIGMNSSLSSKMRMYFEDQQVEKIVFIDKPEATFTPMRKLSTNEMKLKGFEWHAEKRPGSKEDLIKEQAVGGNSSQP